MKRLFAIMMALAMMLSLGVTAFAADTGTITITNARPEETYTLYKIFDAKVSDDVSNAGIVYYATPGSALADELFGAAGTGKDYFDYDATTGVVTLGLKNGKTEAQLFEYLQTITNKTKVDEKDTGVGETTVKFENVPYGYYLVDPTNGALVTVDSTRPNAEVQDKNQTTVTPDKTGEITWLYR